jgi:hypothetical protein
MAVVSVWSEGRSEARMGFHLHKVVIAISETSLPGQRPGVDVSKNSATTVPPCGSIRERARTAAPGESNDSGHGCPRCRHVPRKQRRMRD